MSREWTLYPWFESHGDELVHPDDIGRFRRLVPYGKVFECVEAPDAGYVLLLYRDESFRVRPSLCQRVPAPKFVFGAHVRRVGKPGVTGRIADIYWHFDRREAFFLIAVEGKQLKTRLWASDLDAVEDG